MPSKLSSDSLTPPLGSNYLQDLESFQDKTCNFTLFSRPREGAQRGVAQQLCTHFVKFNYKNIKPRFEAFLTPTPSQLRRRNFYIGGTLSWGEKGGRLVLIMLIQQFLMFFELQDVKRRHNPSWWTNNVTHWHTAVDSTPSWNYQRGLAIGLIVGPAQQYLSHFIYHARAMLQHYEPPVGWNQWSTFIRETRNLESFRNGLTSRVQLGVATGALSIAAQITALRQLNSGWSANFGGFEYSYYRKLITIFAAAVVSSPTGVLLDMTSRAYYSDKTFPKELQKGYKNWLDAFKRIPFEEGPYYLFKNTFPLYIKHIIGPFTAFFCFDFMIDKVSILWRTTNMPVLPLVLSCALFGTYLGAVFTYPFAVTAREMVDIWAKKGGDPFGGNYRKAAIYTYFHQNILGFYPGFFKRYFWHIAPQWFFTIVLAEKLGIFKYWRIDIFNGAADNSPQDSFV